MRTQFLPIFQERGLGFTAASRTPPWLSCGMGMSSEEAPEEVVQKAFSLPYGPLIPVQPVENLLDHQIIRRNMSCLKHDVTLVFWRRTQREKHGVL